MRYFNQRLKAILEFVDPDTWYRQPGALPFIYHNGRLHTGGNSAVMHRSIMMAHVDEIMPESEKWFKDNGHTWPKPPYEEMTWDKYIDKLGKIDSRRGSKADILDKHIWSMRDFLELHSLVGRTSGDPARFVSFWNDDKAIYDKFLIPLLVELVGSDFIHSGTMVSTPVHEDTSVDDMLASRTEELSSEDLEKRKRQADLMRRLHLMGPDEKKKAREELGLVAKGKAPMSQRTGLIPGQKYWAMTSEDQE